MGRANADNAHGSDTDTGAATGDRRTMNEVSHTHPVTDEPFGDVYRRGPAVADGGPKVGRAEGSGSETFDILAAIDHESPDPTVTELWTRGDRGSLVLQEPTESQ